MRSIEREIVGAFIFSKDDKILLGEVGVFAGTRAVPGGGIEPCETKEQAVQREVLEETGIDITGQDVTLIPGFTEGSSEKTLRDTGERIMVHMRFFDFVVRLNKNAADLPSGGLDDFRDAQWYDRTQLQELSLSPPTHSRLVNLGYLQAV